MLSPRPALSRPRRAEGSPAPRRLEDASASRRPFVAPSCGSDRPRARARSSNGSRRARRRRLRRQPRRAPRCTAGRRRAARPREGSRPPARSSVVPVPPCPTAADACPRTSGSETHSSTWTFAGTSPRSISLPPLVRSTRTGRSRTASSALAYTCAAGGNVAATLPKLTYTSGAPSPSHQSGSGAGAASVAGCLNSSHREGRRIDRAPGSTSGRATRRCGT